MTPETLSILVLATVSFGVLFAPVVWVSVLIRRLDPETAAEVDGIEEVELDG